MAPVVCEVHMSADDLYVCEVCMLLHVVCIHIGLVDLDGLEDIMQHVHVCLVDGPQNSV